MRIKLFIISVLCVTLASGTAWAANPSSTERDNPERATQEPAYARSFASQPSATTANATASGIANSIAANPGHVTGASFVTEPPTGTPYAVSDSPMAGFPRNSSTYGILTTGDANSAGAPNDSESAGVDNEGGHVRGDTEYDVTILKVDLNVPDGANCFSVDFKFLSEEFDEYIGSEFNDAFLAELDTSDWTTRTFFDEEGFYRNQIVAPNNFAFIPENGFPITINGINESRSSAEAALGTTYDGATNVLKASTPITPGNHSIYLSVFDQGDGVYDSAAFLDNLTLSTAPTDGCQAGVRSADTQDTTPPNTTISSGPPTTTNNTSATFGFSSAETSSTFECKLDDEAFAPCASSKSYSSVPDGLHTFQVRASDAAGNVDPTPATHNWTVDTIKPKVTTTTPAGTRVAPVANATATFSEKMNHATLGKTTVKLVKRGTQAPVPATVTYNATARRATLNPTRNLAFGTFYTATVTVGARDLAGNQLAANKTWTFKVKPRR